MVSDQCLPVYCFAVCGMVCVTVWCTPVLLCDCMVYLCCCVTVWFTRVLLCDCMVYLCVAV